MASPIGHSLAGASIYALGPGRHHLEPPLTNGKHLRKLALFVVLANLPDCDFIFGWISSGEPNIFHRQWTHSFFFVAISALIVARIWKIYPSLWATWGIYFSVIGSHLVIDFFTGPELGMITRYGQPLLWPATKLAFSSPLALVVGPEHKGLQELFSIHNILAACYEFLIFGLPALLIFRLSARCRKHNQPPRR